MKWYRLIVRRGHPLANACGRVYEHRFVLYSKIGPGEHPCHWCGKTIVWKSSVRSRDLVSDHVDSNWENNSEDNLVQSCHSCNNRRGGANRNGNRLFGNRSKREHGLPVEYPSIMLPSHPLAKINGYIAVHRKVLYEKIGPGPHLCHWCGRAVKWYARLHGHREPDELVTDHMDGYRTNNDPDNLVPSCSGCNKKRGPLPINTHHAEYVAFKCEWCGKTKTANSRFANKFCSRSCQGKAQNASRRKEISCKHCGKKLTVPQKSKQKFCGYSCIHRFLGKIKTEATEWVTKTCIVCDVKFQVSAASARVRPCRYCSRECYYTVIGRSTMEAFADVCAATPATT